MSDDFSAPRSLRQACKRFNVTVDHRFDEIILACADPKRPGSWINKTIVESYSELHRQGMAHSVEVTSDDELVGGLYGVQFGNFFFGESMFHTESNASKVAFFHLCKWLTKSAGPTVIDAQWITPHLASLGFKTVNRNQYAKPLRQYGH